MSYVVIAVYSRPSLPEHLYKSQQVRLEIIKCHFGWCSREELWYRTTISLHKGRSIFLLKLNETKKAPFLRKFNQISSPLKYFRVTSLSFFFFLGATKDYGWILFCKDDIFHDLTWAFQVNFPLNTVLTQSTEPKTKHTLPNHFNYICFYSKGKIYNSINILGTPLAKTFWRWQHSKKTWAYTQKDQRIRKFKGVGALCCRLRHLWFVNRLTGKLSITLKSASMPLISEQLNCTI